MNNTTYTEITKLTLLIFNEIFRKNISNRKHFDQIVTNIVKHNKVDKHVYNYSSLYFGEHSQFRFHLSITDNKTADTVTFHFYMVWNDTGFNESHMSSISVNTGTPLDWYSGRGKELEKDKFEIEL